MALLRDCIAAAIDTIPPVPVAATAKALAAAGIGSTTAASLPVALTALPAPALLALSLALLSLTLTLTLALSLTLTLTLLLALLSLTLLSLTLLTLALLTLALLTLALLTLPTLTIPGARHHALELLAHSFHLVERALHTFVLAWLAVSNHGLGLIHLIAQLVEPLCDRTLSGSEIWTIAATERIGAELHAQLEIILLHVAQRFPELAGCAALRSSQVANCALHVFFEPVQLVHHGFALACESF